MLKNLSDTISMMQDDNYKVRFCAEYLQLRIRMEKLSKYLAELRVKMALGESLPKNGSTYSMLSDQLYNMEQYRRSLEERAIIENIDVWYFL